MRLNGGAALKGKQRRLLHIRLILRIYCGDWRDAECSRIMID